MENTVRTILAIAFGLGGFVVAIAMLFVGVVGSDKQALTHWDVLMPYLEVYLLAACGVWQIRTWLLGWIDRIRARLGETR